MRVHIRVKLKEPPEASRPIESRSKDAAALWRRSSLNGADELVGLARVSEPTCPQARRKFATRGNPAGTDPDGYARRVRVSHRSYHPSRVRELRDGGGASARQAAEHVRRSHD